MGNKWRSKTWRQLNTLRMKKSISRRSPGIEENNAVVDNYSENFSTELPTNIVSTAGVSVLAEQSVYDIPESTTAAHSMEFRNVEEQLMDVNNPVVEPSETPIAIDGRRIVDFQYIFTEFQKINTHCLLLGCTLSNIYIYKENRKGFQSTFFFQCNMCHLKMKISSYDKNIPLDVNHAAVSGAVTVGIGFANLQQLVETMEIPAMTGTTFREMQNKVSSWYECTAILKMKEAAQKEAEYAREIGSIDSNGTPLITVVADGCWSKRSYGSNYSALSGAAAIVGQKFGQVLFFKVKNKYCVICTRAENKNERAREHVCFKNHTGSSTSMESDILVEGFKTSMSTHGIIYSKLIADGDSSTYNKILKSRPYKNLTVEKIECRNHLLRNFCNKLRKITTETFYPLASRKILSARLLRLRTAVRCAISYRKGEIGMMSDKIFKLNSDILNGPRHVFGDHKSCHIGGYFCKRTESGETNWIPLLEKCKMLDKIMLHVNTLASHSRSLICDVDSNVVERFNHIIAKMTGGKRINYTSRNSYQSRCAAAVVSFNSRRIHYAVHKQVFGNSPGTWSKRMEARRANIAKKKKVPKKKLSFALNPIIPDCDYGEHLNSPDMADELFTEAKNVFLESLNLSDADRSHIENATVLQSKSGEWMELRRKRLTASWFGKICKRRLNISCGPLVKSIMYQSPLGVPSVRFGNDNEAGALIQLSIQLGLTFSKCGLFLDECHPFLGATPKSKGDNFIVEVKCPYSARGMEPLAAIKVKKIKFWYFDKDGEVKINKNHDWYFQIQGQLHVTKSDICVFGVWTSNKIPLKVETIRRDDYFFHFKMLKRLQNFYFDCYLPEIIDPRYERGMEIRNPPYIEQAILSKKVTLKRNA